MPYEGTMAYRERPAQKGSVLLPVEVVTTGPPGTRQVQIRWLSGPDDGSTQWVGANHLVCPWSEAQTLLRDEERMAALIEAGATRDAIEEQAAVWVLTWRFGSDTLDVGIGTKARAKGVVAIMDFEARCAAAGLDGAPLLDDPLAFIDRQGNYFGPLSLFVRLAQEICRERTERVMTALVGDLERTFRRLLVMGKAVYGNLTMQRDVMTIGPTEEQALALVRRWCGDDQTPVLLERVVVDDMRAEIERLRAVAKDAVDYLKANGGHVKAAAVWERIWDTKLADEQLAVTLDERTPPWKRSTAPDGTTRPWVVKLETKGRVRLPNSVRDAFGVADGDTLEVWYDDGWAHVRPAVGGARIVRSGV